MNMVENPMVIDAHWALEERLSKRDQRRAEAEAIERLAEILGDTLDTLEDAKMDLKKYDYFTEIDAALTHIKKAANSLEAIWNDAEQGNVEIRI